MKVSKTLCGRGKSPTKEKCPVCQKLWEKPFKRRQKVTCSKKCGYKWAHHSSNPNAAKNKSAASRAGRKSASVQARNRRSKNEAAFYQLCKSKWPDSLANEPMFNGWDADVIIPSLQIAVSWNGPWHYRKLAKKHSVKQVQNRDRLKKIAIENAGYQSYIIRDDGSYDLKFVTEQFNIFVRHQTRLVLGSNPRGPTNKSKKH